MLAYLAHEILDDAVEGRALVAEALLAGAESAEVLCESEGESKQEHRCHLCKNS